MAENSEQVFEGIAVSPGLGRAPAYLFYHGEMEIPRYPVPPERLEEEVARFEQGLLATRRQISAIRTELEEKVGQEEASIFDAHQLVLEDRALIEDTITEVVETGLNIEFCLHSVANRYLEAFAQIDDDYIKERASDIRDVTKRLISNLLGHDEKVQQSVAGRHFVLIAKDLSPSDTALLNAAEVKAIVTEQGSFTSHSVIMARSLNIAAVVGVHGLYEQAGPDDEVLVDGYSGRVYLNPSAETLERYGRLETEKRFLWERYEAERGLDCVTADGHKYPLMLNVEGFEAEDRLKGSGANGVGLLRTENLFMSAQGFPDEERQFLFYAELVRKMAPHPVTIRTLDLGGDKNPHRSLTDYSEANPFMGLRGIRFCLENPAVFKEQLRAILRASRFGPVKILYPMVCNLEEMRFANKLLTEAKAELRASNQAFDEQIPVGAMIEVPSAAVIVDMLAEEADFFSIGTNDLVQYMLAVDRINDRISYLYDGNHPAIIRTLNFIFEQGRLAGRPVNVCGELAGDPLYAPLLIGLGVDYLSVSMGQLALVKFLIRRIRVADAKRLATRVLASTDPIKTSKLLHDFHSKTMREVIAEARAQG
jgi:phosphotransferase system enzyme I (PtsI)